jgi:hypothetical protein
MGSRGGRKIQGFLGAETRRLSFGTVQLNWKPAADCSQRALRDSSQAVPSLGAGAGKCQFTLSAITMTIRKLPKAVLRIEYLYLCTCRHQPALTRRNRGAKLRASTPILLVGLLILFQCIAAGQNNSAHEAGPNPETTPVSWGAGRTPGYR